MEASLVAWALLPDPHYEMTTINVVRVHSSNVRGFAHLPICVQVR